MYLVINIIFNLNLRVNFNLLFIIFNISIEIPARSSSMLMYYIKPALRPTPYHCTALLLYIVDYIAVVYSILLCIDALMQ